MAHVTFRNPNSFRFEEFNLPDRHLPELPSDEAGSQMPLTELEHSRVDFKTFICDIFLDAADRVVVIGPPPYGLRDKVPPQAARLEIPALDFQQPLELEWQRNNRHLYFHKAVTRLPAGACDHEIFFCLKVNGVEKRIAIDRFKCTQERVIATIQKDNAAHWIMDWIAYYGQLGVREFLIYDNGSENLKEVMAAAAALKEEYRISIIQWPFPYGVGRFGRLRFMQNTVLNHALAASCESDWLLNFDIDEYLALDKFGDTLDGLIDHAKGHSGIVVDGFRVPVPPEFDVTGKYHAADFVMRERQSQGKAWKYLAKPSDTRFLNVHTLHLRDPATQVRLGAEEAHFLHFMGLTSGDPEKVEHRLRDRTQIEPSRHAPMDLVKRMMGSL